MRSIADMMIAHQRAVITGLREQLTQANERADTNLRALNRISPLLAEANARITRLNREVTVSELKKCGMQGLAAVTYLRAINALIAKRDAAPPAAKEEHA